jgi:cytochrome P450
MVGTDTAAVPVRTPGPSTLFSSIVYRPGRSPLVFFANLVRQYGDVVHFKASGEHMYLVTNPRHVREILVTNQRNFRKGRGLERTKGLLGEGLLTSEGETHLRQRRLMQPAFHKDRIATYAAVMTEYAERASGQWSDGATLDVAEAMMRLTLNVVGKTLFNADVESQAKDVGSALGAVMGSFWIRMLPFADTIERLPLPALRRAREARVTLDQIVYRMIAERRQTPGDRGDLLSMLLLARDEEDNGRGMSDDQVRDEALTIFLAGHETTANVLSWTWYLLSQSPEVEGRLHEEVDRVLAGRVPRLEDIPSLGFVEKVVTESMRLYPPAWIIGRRAIDAFTLDAYSIPARSLVAVSPYLTQRDARYFPEPERFDPDRWSTEFKAGLPPFAYYPFGGGTRRCIGESFAWMELVLVIAAIARNWQFRLVPGHRVVPQPLVTLRLKHGLQMVAAHRH